MPQQASFGLALASGGARGLAHAGVLEVLEAEGLHPAAIAGTSMGSIVGGLYAEYPNAAVTWRRLRHYVLDTDFAAAWQAFVAKDSAGGEDASGGRVQEIWEFLQRKLVALRTVTRPNLVEQDRLRGPLQDLFHCRRFADLKIPFAAVAVDLVSGRKIVFDRGDLIEAVYASSAIPAIFPPLEREGMMICDGGAAYRTPVDECRGLGTGIVVAVDIPAFEPSSFHTGLDIIMRNNAIARQRLNEFVLAQADLIIRPSVQDVHWADFRAGETCRERGADAARQAVPTLRALLDRRAGLGGRLRELLERRLLHPCQAPPEFGAGREGPLAGLTSAGIGSPRRR